MWNLDRAFSEVGRQWKFRYFAFIQTKYCRWFIPKMKMVIYYLHAMTLIQTIDYLKKKVQHAQIKIFSEGSNSDNFFYSWWERSQIPLKVVHNWPSNETPFKSPAKRHLNGVSLVDQWWLNIKNAGLEVLRFSIHFVRVAFTSTKDTASPYIFKRIFVSMPIHLLALFLLFIMSNLFYRGGGGFQFVCFKRS